MATPNATQACDAPRAEAISSAWYDPRRALRRLISRVAAGVGCGRLTIELPDGQTLHHRGSAPGPQATLVLHRWRALGRLFVGGDIGFAEGFMAGDWSTPDLAALLELASRNAAVESAARVPAPLRLLHLYRHRRNRNDRRGSRRNIAAHYDLGNAFYRHWLDAGMSYSSAIFREGIETLEQAQETKLDRVGEWLALQGGERVLEIGCGWGALAERLISRHGADVTALTLSREQLAYTSERLRQHDPRANPDIRLQDYRDVSGSFDRVVSIEMLEAVGEAYWPTFFDKLHACLRPGAIAVLQVITIDERRFPAYRRTPDFIQRYIFPGGMLPTATAIADRVARAGLDLVATEQFGASYARTLVEWRRRFLLRWPQIESLGFDLRFRRMWEYYLAYCEAGFRAGAIDVGLFRIARPASDAI